MNIEKLIIYSFINILLSIFFNLEFKKNIFIPIFLSFFTIDYLSYSFYSGFGPGHFPSVFFLTISDFMILIAYLFIKNKKNTFSWEILIILLYLIVNIYKTNQLFMYIIGLIRGIIIPVYLYKLIKYYKVPLESILRYIFIGILSGFFFSLLALLFIGLNPFVASFNPLFRPYLLRTLGATNIIAGFLVFLIPVYLFNNQILKGIILFVILFFTMTRGGIIIGFLEVIIFLFTSTKSYGKKIFFFMLITLAIYFLAEPLFFSRFTVSSHSGNVLSNISNQNNAQSRYYLWLLVLDFIKSQSINVQFWGHGFCTFRDSVYIPNLYNGHVSSPHNLFLSILFNYGYFGILVSIIWIVNISKRILKKKKYSLLIALVSFILYGTTVGTVLLPEYRQIANYYILVILLTYLFLNNRNNNLLEKINTEKENFIVIHR